jgi:hypothetical protein
VGGVHLVHGGVLDRIRVLLGAVSSKRSRLLISDMGKVVNTQDKISELEIMNYGVPEKVFRSP